MLRHHIQVVLIIVLIYIMLYVKADTIEPFDVETYNTRLDDLNVQISKLNEFDPMRGDLVIERDQINEGLELVRTSGIQDNPIILMLISYDTLKKLVTDTENAYWDKVDVYSYENQLKVSPNGNPIINPDDIKLMEKLNKQSDLKILSLKILMEYEQSILAKELQKKIDKDAPK